AHCRSRSHHAHDRVRRAARVAASPALPALRRAAARARLARARAAPRECGRGRRHGARPARHPRGPGPRAAWLPRRRLEPDGEDALDAFLRRTEILVCLLPATPATGGILDLKLLHKLKRDGAAGRAHLTNATPGER